MKNWPSNNAGTPLAKPLPAMPMVLCSGWANNAKPFLPPGIPTGVCCVFNVVCNSGTPDERIAAIKAVHQEGKPGADRVAALGKRVNKLLRFA